MLRHEFQPGKLIAGIFVSIAGITYVGDAGDAWETPWFAVIPLLGFGLALAGAVALLTGAIRSRTRRRAAAPTGNTPETAGPSRPPEIPN
ncbi:hypothetical protein [Streptomyces sp. NBC_00576]|uniref:hypothetical protein n=1 Tax=Streptomyces sp. NBC_00576 TaxID=2903665 RepID=UPI002E81C897|nr:hypothetical protein [Streptomyces sp. NBC_00576]WUB71618.1 hypothetical protein OG734_16765 [Streptomyces sp. NBC_00576]